MGKINMKGVILGGLVAGIVLNVIDAVLWGVILKSDFDAAMQALNKPAMSTNMMIWYIVLDFLFGIYLIWLYAAIRPRFGPGPKTAIYAGLILWVALGLLHALAEAPMGVLPQRLWVISTLVYLVQAPLAALAGGKVYTEPAAT